MILLSVREGDTHVMIAAISKEKSKNKKIGVASATYASQSSCPDTCVFRGNGCYYELGPLGIIARRLNNSGITDRVEIARQEAEAIDRLTGQYDLRMHVGGDCTDVEGVRLLAAAAARYTAKHGKTVWTYTHEHSIPRHEWGCIQVLLSCETTEQAAEAVKNGYGAAIVVGDFPSEKAYDLGEGLKGIPCPKETGRANSCVECRLCLNADKLDNRVVVFAAHGPRKNTVKRVVKVIN